MNLWLHRNMLYVETDSPARTNEDNLVEIELKNAIGQKKWAPVISCTRVHFHDVFDWWEDHKYWRQYVEKIPEPKGFIRSLVERIRF